MTIGKLSGQCDFGQKGQSYCNQRGQSCVAKRVKVAWLFHGEYEHGYMVLLVDSKNNIYGVMDDYVEGFGNDYFKMLNQLYNR